ncbi:phosphotransferase [Bradyrhizobium sp.]|uniref:phosphotransferase n=1 Tax=Bradyrhizobium sp. TaxID=376 RepID=UPI003C68EC43
MTQLARRLGMGRVNPFFLHESQHVSVRLLPYDVVARAMPVSAPEATARLTLEVDIARHLAGNRAPVAGLAADWPGGPHIQDGFVITLWKFIEHVAANGDDARHVSEAADALRRVHRALSDYRGELPSFWHKLDRCDRLLENEATTPALGPVDRAFLRSTYGRLREMVTSTPFEPIPIHGDVHLGNVLITPQGALWNDLEDVSLGPCEWDVGWLPEVDLAQFEPMNQDLLSAFHYLRSLCTSVWCWARYDVPEKREAADYHLEYLRAEFGSRRSD